MQIFISAIYFAFASQSSFPMLCIECCLYDVRLLLLWFCVCGGRLGSPKYFGFVYFDDIKANRKIWSGKYFFLVSAHFSFFRVSFFPVFVCVIFYIINIYLPLTRTANRILEHTSLFDFLLHNHQPDVILAQFDVHVSSCFFLWFFCRFYRINKCAYRRIETKYFDMRFYCNIVAQTLNESTELHERGKKHSLLPFVRPFVRSLNCHPNVVESVDGSLKVSS